MIWLLQGFAVVLRREALTEETALEAFSKVLREGSYGEAARKVSRRMQMRKRSPVQEAGGTHTLAQLHFTYGRHFIDHVDTWRTRSNKPGTLHSRVCSLHQQGQHSHICTSMLLSA